MDCYVLPLPWPEKWKDVTKVRIQMKYTPKDGGNELFVADQVIAIETAPQDGLGGSSTLAKTGPSERRGIPNLKKVMRESMGTPDRDTVLAAKPERQIVRAHGKRQP